jgi:phosphoserine phosphatase
MMTPAAARAAILITELATFFIGTAFLSYFIAFASALEPAAGEAPPAQFPVVVFEGDRAKPDPAHYHVMTWDEWEKRAAQKPGATLLLPDSSATLSLPGNAEASFTSAPAAENRQSVELRWRTGNGEQVARLRAGAQHRGAVRAHAQRADAAYQRHRGFRAEPLPGPQPAAPLARAPRILWLSRLTNHDSRITPFKTMHLIMQGEDVPTRTLKELAKISGASAIEQVAPGVFRLRAASPGDGIAALCSEARLDWAWVPEERRLADFRLLVMDMDSTLITIETIDELADFVGKKEPVAAITEQAMRGEIQYDESLRRRVAVLEGLEAAALERVYQERVRLSPGAERLLAGIRQAGLKTLLVSGGFTHITERLKSRLGLDYTHSNTLEIANGRLTGKVQGRIVNADGKREALLAVRSELGIGKEQIIGMGDGANDLKFMGEAGVSIAYHAKPIVRGQTTHALNYVGLDGALHLFN